MKLYKLSSFLVAFFLLGTATLTFAQYDDVYFDPSDDTEVYTAPSSDYDYDEDYQDDDFDASKYEDDDYDYYYTSRLRRFYRPYAGFDFYAPAYVDGYYYDPFFSPGSAIYVSNRNAINRSGVTLVVNSRFGNPYSYYNPYYNPYSARTAYYGFSNPYRGYNNWGSYGGYSNYGYAGSRFGAANYGYNPYCPPSWSTGSYNANANVGNNNRDTRVRSNNSSSTTRRGNTNYGKGSRVQGTTRSNNGSVRRSNSPRVQQRSNTRTSRQRSNYSAPKQRYNRTQSTIRKSNSSYAPSKTRTTSPRSSSRKATSRRGN